MNLQLHYSHVKSQKSVPFIKIKQAIEVRETLIMAIEYAYIVDQNGYNYVFFFFD